GGRCARAWRRRPGPAPSGCGGPRVAERLRPSSAPAAGRRRPGKADTLLRMNRTLARALIALAACRGESSRDATTLEQHELDSLVTTLMPAVAQATGLEFKSTPRAAIRTRDEVRTYLLAKLGAELPQERLDGIVSAYRLLGLIPDSLDIASLFVDLYTEQV